MDRFHIPGDPYFPVHNGGWLSEEDDDPIEDDVPIQEPAAAEEEPEEEPEEDPEEEPEEDPEEDPEEEPEEEPEEDPEEDPEEEPEEEPEVDSDGDELMGDDSDAESEVIDPRYPERDMHAPRPGPGFQVYRHPGGPLWMHTPRKRVLPTPVPETFVIPTSSQDPAWAGEVRQWCRDQGQLFPFGMNRALLNIEDGGSADRLLPVMVRRITRLDNQARASTSQILDVGATAEVTAVRFRRLDQEHDETRDLVGRIAGDVATTRDELRESRAWRADMEAQLAAAVRETEETREQLREMRALVAALRGPPAAPPSE